MGVAITDIGSVVFYHLAFEDDTMNLTYAFSSNVFLPLEFQGLTEIPPLIDMQDEIRHFITERLSSNERSAG